MSKIMFSFMICCNLTGFCVYADYIKGSSAKLVYIENLHILETALQNKQTLEKHLLQYAINAQERQTGDTALHYLSNKTADIYQALASSLQITDPHFNLKFLNLSSANPYLTRQYEQTRDLIEYLLVQDASPYIKNKKGNTVIDSQGFSLYIKQVLKTYSPSADKVIYKVYLAGPEVFLPFYQKIRDFLQVQVLLFNEYHLKSAEYHIQGLFPSDESQIDSYPEYFTVGSEIYKRNRRLMQASHAIIANMIEHDGSSMDVGTAYEIGEMVQAKKTVVGYYDKSIYHLQYETDITEQKIYSSPEDLVYEHQDFSRGYLKIPDNLMVLMATLSSNEEIQFPASSWEALFVLKAKWDSKTKR